MAQGFSLMRTDRGAAGRVPARGCGDGEGLAAGRGRCVAIHHAVGRRNSLTSAVVVTPTTRAARRGRCVAIHHAVGRRNGLSSVTPVLVTQAVRLPVRPQIAAPNCKHWDAQPWQGARSAPYIRICSMHVQHLPCKVMQQQLLQFRMHTALCGRVSMAAHRNVHQIFWPEIAADH